MTLDSDTPTSAQAQGDQFGRLAFAKHLAAQLRLQPGQDSLVVGLEGEWGGGKSWVIERIKAELLAKQIIAIQFNPWLIGAENELIDNFLQEMAAQISEAIPLHAQVKDKLQTLAGTLAAYGSKLHYLKYLKYVPVVGAVGEFIEDHTEKIQKGVDKLSNFAKPDELSVHARRAKVEAALQELAQPIVVVIDDLDRLRQREIQTIVQLVKAIANFKGVAFLLSYDAKYVAQAISHDGTLAAGSAYLEKIVQLACPLPPLIPWVYRDWLHERCRQLLAEKHKTLSEFEAQRMPDVVKLVARLLRHPRDVVRWLNRLRFAWNNLAEAIDFDDWMLVEALQIVSPDSLRALIKRQGLLFEQYEEHFETNYTFQSPVEALSGPSWADVVANDEQVQRVVMALFPHLAHPNPAIMRFERDPQAFIHRRLQQYEHWMRYLNLSQIPGKGDAALVLPILGDSASYQDLPNRFDGLDEFSDFCLQIFHFLERESIDDCAQFFTALCRTAHANWSANIPEAQLDLIQRSLRRLLDLAWETYELEMLNAMQSHAPLSLFGQTLYPGSYWQAAWLTCFNANPNWQEKDNALIVLHYLATFSGLTAARAKMQELVAKRHLATLQRIEERLALGGDDNWLALLPALETLKPIVEQYTAANFLRGGLQSFLANPANLEKIQGRVADSIYHAKM